MPSARRRVTHFAGTHARSERSRPRLSSGVTAVSQRNRSHFSSGERRRARQQRHAAAVSNLGNHQVRHTSPTDHLDIRHQAVLAASL